jgi:arginyl-tRNA synthetase
VAQAFNGFYNLPQARSSLLKEERDDVRRWRTGAILYVRNQLANALDLMGIDVPARM